MFDVINTYCSQLLINVLLVVLNLLRLCFSLKGKGTLTVFTLCDVLNTYCRPQLTYSEPNPNIAQTYLGMDILIVGCEDRYCSGTKWSQFHQ